MVRAPVAISATEWDIFSIAMLHVSESRRALTWLGTVVRKLPTDLWTYQEILTERRPDYILETGTWYGGSALFLASVCQLLSHGLVVSIDLLPPDCPLPEHDRLRYHIGWSSTNPSVVEHMRTMTAGASTMVVLDSDHRAEHVLAELDAYAPLVTLGQYLVVEDGPYNPVGSTGPAAAVAEWLPEHPEFVHDAARERFDVTTCRGGFLRRVA